MLPMFDLLLSLGADPDAVDECGCNWLAAAAAAGYHGLWQALTTEDRMAGISMRSVHASRVLLRATQYTCNVPAMHGRSEFFNKAKDFLQRLYKAKGASAAFARQLNEPASDLFEHKVNELCLVPSHPLLAAMQGPQGSEVMRFTGVSTRHCLPSHCLFTCTFVLAQWLPALKINMILLSRYKMCKQQNVTACDCSSSKPLGW